MHHNLKILITITPLKKYLLVNKGKEMTIKKLDF
jgi:hypothetical protein